MKQSHFDTLLPIKYALGSQEELSTGWSICSDNWVVLIVPQNAASVHKSGELPNLSPPNPLSDQIENSSLRKCQEKILLSVPDANDSRRPPSRHAKLPSKVMTTTTSSSHFLPSAAANSKEETPKNLLFREHPYMMSPQGEGG